MALAEQDTKDSEQELAEASAHLMGRTDIHEVCQQKLADQSAASLRRDSKKQSECEKYFKIIPWPTLPKLSSELLKLEFNGAKLRAIKDQVYLRTKAYGWKENAVRLLSTWRRSDGGGDDRGLAGDHRSGAREGAPTRNPGPCLAERLAESTGHAFFIG